MFKKYLLSVILAAGFTAHAAAEPMQLVFDATSGGSIALPLYGVAACTVSWGDGSPAETVTVSGDLSHAFAVAGPCTVQVSGALDTLGKRYTSWTGVSKLIAVASFGDLGLTSLRNAFNNADNLESVPAVLPATVTDLSSVFRDFSGDSVANLGAWDCGSVTDMSEAFYNAIKFNQDIGGWDVSAVRTMYRMFSNCWYFNQDLSGWAVDSVTNMSQMFSSAPVFNADISSWNTGAVTTMYSMFSGANGFNADISGWDVSSVTNMERMFYNADRFHQDLSGWDISGATNLNSMFTNMGRPLPSYDSLLIKWSALDVQTGASLGAGDNWYTDAGAVARQKLIDEKGWVFDDAGWALVLEFDLAAGDSIALPLYGSVDCNIYWGDGSDAEMVNTHGLAGHRFDSTGTWTVAVTGSLGIFGKLDYTWEGVDKLKAVRSFGGLGLTSLQWAFARADSLVSVPARLPATVTNLSGTFYRMSRASVTNLDAWAVDSVTNMSETFARASNFNQDLSSWNTGSVTNMNGMFSGAASFNADISGWDVGSVTTMGEMFFSARSFNADISAWDVGSVTYMYWMFRGAEAFDRNLGNWDVTSVGVMSDMFMQTGLSTENYDSLLIGWAADSVKSGVTFGAGSITYSSAGAAARQQLIDVHGWTITDGGLVNMPPAVTSAAADTAAQGVPFSYVATATDPDGVPVITFGDYPGWLTVTGDTIAGTPPAGAGDTSFVVIADDGELADTVTVQLYVIPVNSINDIVHIPAQGISVPTGSYNLYGSPATGRGVGIVIMKDENGNLVKRLRLK